MITARSLAKHYGDFPALDDVTFDLDDARILGVIGHNGAGKTTLLKIMAGLVTPTAGNLLIDGIDVEQYTLRNLRRHVAVVTQQVTLFNDTVASNIAYGDLAGALGVPAQAVGQACGGNPIPIIVPCHRVLGATGLGGFSAPGGVETKIALLKHEGAASLLL